MDDLISRQAVLDVLKIYKVNLTVIDIIRGLPITSMAIPSAEPSRDMEEIAEVINCDADAETKCKMISNILTAKPHYFEKQEPKTGHWIEDTNGTYTDNHDTWECSECGNAQILLEGTPKDNDYNYCPNCGARLVEPTCDTCEYTTAAFNPCNACKDKSEYKPKESEDT